MCARYRQGLRCYIKTQNSERSCGGVTLAGCQVPTQLLSLPLPKQDREERIRWKCSFFCCHQQNKLDWGKFKLIYCQLKQSWMARNNEKTQNTFTSSIPNPLPPPVERGWGMRSAHNNSSLPLLPPHTFPLLQRGLLHGVCRGIWITSSCSPRGLSGLFLTFFLTILAVGSAVPCAGSAGPSRVQQGAALAAPQWGHPADPGHLHPYRPTNFINRALKAEIPLGKLGNTVSCHLSPGRRAPSQFLCQSLCTRQVLWVSAVTAPAA